MAAPGAFVENLNRPGILEPQTTCDLAGEKCQSTLIRIVDHIRLFDGPGDGIPSSSTAMISSSLAALCRREFR
jgi:hypothetical protein